MPTIGTGNLNRGGNSAVVSGVASQQRGKSSTGQVLPGNTDFGLDTPVIVGTAAEFAPVVSASVTITTGVTAGGAATNNPVAATAIAPPTPLISGTGLTPGAFPVVGSTSTETSAILAGIGDVNAPAGIVVGNLLLGFIATAWSSACTVSGGYTAIATIIEGTSTVLQIVGRIADGTASDTLNIGGNNAPVAVGMLRITGHAVSSIASDIKIATTHGPNNPTLTIDPPNLDAGSTKNWLWIATVMAWFVNLGDQIWNGPSGFTDNIILSGGASNNPVVLGVSRLNLAAQTEDPGTFPTNATGRPWCSATLAIPSSSSLPAATVAASSALVAPLISGSAAEFTPLAADAVSVTAPLVSGSAAEFTPVLTKTATVALPVASGPVPLEFRTFQSAGGGTGSIAIGISPAQMSGSQAGDLLVAHVTALGAVNMSNTGGQTWTQQASLTDGTFVFKTWTAIYDGTGNGITTGFVVFNGYTSDFVDGVVLCYKKNTFDPNSIVDSSATGSATGATFTIPAITTTKSNVTRVVVLGSGIGQLGGGGFASPFGAISSGGFNLRTDSGCPGADNKPSHRDQDKFQAVAGSSGVETVSNSRSSNAAFCCHLGINAGPAAGATVFSPSMAASGNVTAPLVSAADTMFATSESTAVTLAAPLVAGASAEGTPSIAATAAITTPSVAGSASEFAPAMAASGNVTAPLVSGSGANIGPTVSASAALAASLVSGSAAKFAPTLATTASVTTPLVSGSAAKFTPTVSATAAITAALVSAVATLFSTTESTTASVTAPLIPGAAALFAPSLSTIVGITSPLISGSAATFAPLASASVEITAALTSAMAALFSPSLSTVIGVTTSLVSGTGVLFNPTVASATIVTTALVSAGGTLYSVTVSTTSSGFPVKIWNGSTWVTTPIIIKRWDGAAWVVETRPVDIFNPDSGLWVRINV